MSKIFNHRESFELECGKRLSSLHLSYTTIGTLNEEKDNVIWIFHALTANDNPLEWWHGLVGEHCLFTPKDHFIVCVNTPGSCYGSIGPLDINEETGKPFYHTFPWFTPRDMIRAYQLLKKELGIEKIFIGLGGSMGGQQLLEWAIDEPDLFEHIIPIATNARHSAWGIAFTDTIQIICSDRTYTGIYHIYGNKCTVTAMIETVSHLVHYMVYSVIARSSSISDRSVWINYSCIACIRSTEYSHRVAYSYHTYMLVITELVDNHCYCIMSGSIVCDRYRTMWYVCHYHCDDTCIAERWVTIIACYVAE